MTRAFPHRMSGLSGCCTSGMRWHRGVLSNSRPSKLGACAGGGVGAAGATGARGALMWCLDRRAAAAPSQAFDNTGWRGVDGCNCCLLARHRRAACSEGAAPPQAKLAGHVLLGCHVAAGSQGLETGPRPLTQVFSNTDPEAAIAASLLPPRCLLSKQCAQKAPLLRCLLAVCPPGSFESCRTLAPH